jgi:hypothetical protein
MGPVIDVPGRRCSCCRRPWDAAVTYALPKATTLSGPVRLHSEDPTGSLAVTPVLGQGSAAQTPDSNGTALSLSRACHRIS